MALLVRAKRKSTKLKHSIIMKFLQYITQDTRIIECSWKEQKQLLKALYKNYHEIHVAIDCNVSLLKINWDTDAIAQNPKLSYLWCLFVARISPSVDVAKFEVAIFKSAKYSYLHALNFRRGRCISAESMIATHPKYSYLYALNVLRSPWIDAEGTICAYPKWSALYAIVILSGEFPRGEAAIASNNIWKHQYDLFLEFLEKEKQQN